MKCYFLRHGVAVEAEEFRGSDSDRPLTDEGRERMAREARTMAKLDLDLELIVSSPLVRAKQTAEIVAKALGMHDRLIEDDRAGLGFGPARLGELLREHSDAKSILLVGHEPSMSQTIGQVVGGARIDFKKGALARVDFAAPSSGGILLWVVPPKVLAL